MRDSGILLPVASLPSKYGVGDLGSRCFEWIDLLAKNGVKIWQILPINPLGYGNSPYQPYSAFAGDELYISLEELHREGMLEDLPQPFREQAQAIDYEQSRSWKEPFLRKAFLHDRKKREDERLGRESGSDRMQSGGTQSGGVQNGSMQSGGTQNSGVPEGKGAFSQWGWVRPYAVYRAFRKENGDTCWSEWPKWQRLWPSSQERSLAEWEEEILYHIFLQEIFHNQWMNVKKYAASKGVRIMGDIPFYVGLDSADVWMNPDYFALDPHGRPMLVAGVPPDYFSETGQRWGNPIYNWEHMKRDHYLFWRERLRYAAHLFDVVRLDHFRAFDTYWSIPASCPTAVEGKWVEAPGYQALDAVLEEIPKNALVVEDLGDLRPQVEQLKNHYGFAGMKIFQFTLDFKGKRVQDTMKGMKNVIAYPGNHDNATIGEWQRTLNPSQRRKLRRFLKKEGCSQGSLSDRVLCYLLRSPANQVVISLGDLLELGISGRLNVPGTVGSPNWEWRLCDFAKTRHRMALFRQKLCRKD